MRKNKNMSQTALSDICGISENVLSRIEHQKMTPYLKNALKISAALNTTINDIFIKNEKENGNTYQ